SIATEGAALVTTDRWNEVYEIPRTTPDMVIKNVVWGTKKIFWNGEVSIHCAKTKYSATFNFKESGNENVVKGELMYTNDNDEDEVLYTIDGKCGGVFNMTNKRTKEKTVLLDCESKLYVQFLVFIIAIVRFRSIMFSHLIYLLFSSSNNRS